MEKISIKTTHNSKEGINKLIEELPFQADNMLVSPGYVITENKLTFYLLPDYTDQIKKSIILFVQEYGLEVCN
jgi:hypothetical protein